MKDETYSFISDVKEKGIVARSSHNRRSHTGRGGKVRFPSDNLSKKELQKMSGECASYRLNEPMKWEEFLAMPDDIQKIYVYALRKKYKVPNADLGRMMGVERTCISNHLMRHGFEKAPDGRCKWDKEGFYAWVNGVNVPRPVPEEDVQEEEDVQQEEAPESFVEDDLPFDIPESELELNRYYQKVPQTACPNTGSLSFKCPANIALNTMKDLLQNEMVAISITWRVIEEGGDDDA